MLLGRVNFGALAGPFMLSSTTRNEPQLAKPGFVQQSRLFRKFVSLFERPIKETTEKIDFIAQNRFIASSIASSKTVELPNFRTVHINTHNGNVYFLTPIGGERPEQYGIAPKRSIIYEIYKVRLRQYGVDGLHLEREILPTSIAEHQRDLTSENHTVKLWIETCHFVIVKSDQGRYWFLHYDPYQTEEQFNKHQGYRYYRSNYSDLKPLLPYDHPEVSLQTGEKVQVLVVQNHCKSFNWLAFERVVGKENIESFQNIDLEKYYPGEGQIDIEFNTHTDGLCVYLHRNREKETLPFYAQANLFD